MKFNHARMYADLRRLVSFAPRVSGTRGERRTARYIRRQFKKAGLSNVKIIKYKMPNSRKKLRIVMGELMGIEKFLEHCGLSGSTIHSRKINVNEYILIGAHHDTAPHTDGATDNAIGVATVMELARQMPVELGTTVRFVTWGGEEKGTLGSKTWFEANKDDVLKNCLMYLNFDSNNAQIKDGEHLIVASNDQKMVGRILSSLVDNRDEMVKILSDTYQGATEKTRYGVVFKYAKLIKGASGDYAIFAKNGIKTASTGGSDSSLQHTADDTIDKINVGSAVLVGKIFGRYVLHVAK